MRLYLIRHGETEYNLRKLIQGYGEVPLNDTGIRQAAALGRRMAQLPLDHIYASDLRRATMTAAIVAAHTGTPIEYETAFRERNPGIHLTDKSYDEAEGFFTDIDYAPPGGETVQVFGDRVKRAFDDLLEKERARQRNVAVVTHGMVCAAFLRVCLDEPLEQIAATRWPNASLTIVDYNGAWNLITLGDATHLEETPSHATGA